MLLALAALLAGNGSSVAGTNSDVIAIDQRGFQLGQLVWNWQAHNRAVTLTDFIGAFGHESTCVIGQSRAASHVAWQSRGVRGDFTTLGGFPHSGDNACTAPAYVQPDTVEVFDGVWRSGRGLHVGETVARLRVMYPRATQIHSGVLTASSSPAFATAGSRICASSSTRKATELIASARRRRGRPYAPRRGIAGSVRARRMFDPAPPPRTLETSSQNGVNATECSGWAARRRGEGKGAAERARGCRARSVSWSGLGVVADADGRPTLLEAPSCLSSSAQAPSSARRPIEAVRLESPRRPRPRRSFRPSCSARRRFGSRSRA